MREFYTLIDRLNAASPEQRPLIEADIRNRFEVEKAVFALDMSGFSLTVRRDGILSYLGMIRRMQNITSPIIAELGGALVKHEADNVLALFDRPADAVRAALAINEQLRLQGGERPIRVSIGIDFGRLLSINGADCFGDPVNTACKLGEDIAQAGEILISHAARVQLDADLLASAEVTDLTLSIAGIQIPASRVRARSD